MAVEIDHIGIAVESIKESLALYCELIGFPLDAEETVPAEQVRVAMLPAGSSRPFTRIELLESAGENSPIARFLKNHGPGIHHIALRVDDLEVIAARLKSAGCRLLSEPRTGAGGHSYVFVHPRSTGGVLLELVANIHSPEGAN